MKTNAIACTLLLTSLPLLSACSGNGAPGNGDIEHAMEEMLRFQVRQQLGAGEVDVDIKDVQSRDCIAKGEHWICNVEAKVVMKAMRNGEMQSKEEAINGDITMTRTKNGWEASE